MFSFEVRDEFFLDWMDSLEYNFSNMIETMKYIADEIVMKKTQEITPLDTGRLSRSFRWTVVTDNSRFKVLQVRMSALNPDDGFDYAYVQHRGYHTSKYGKTVYYDRDKIHELGFFHYSEFDGGFETRLGGLNDPWKVHRGESRYLELGITYSKQSAFEVIERDYLSMFNGSYIV